MKYTFILALGIFLGVYISHEPQIEYVNVGTCSELFQEYKKINGPNKGKDIFDTETGCNYINEWNKVLGN